MTYWVKSDVLRSVDLWIKGSVKSRAFLLHCDASSPPPSGASHGLFYPEIPPPQYLCLTSETRDSSFPTHDSYLSRTPLISSLKHPTNSNRPNRDFETEIQMGQQLDELIGVGKSVRHNGRPRARCAFLPSRDKLARNTRTLLEWLRAFLGCNKKQTVHVEGMLVAHFLNVEYVSFLVHILRKKI